MKIRFTILGLFFIFSIQTTQAQFLKKLKQKAQEAAERTILKKTDEVVSEKTEKTIDDVTQGSGQTDENKEITFPNITNPQVSETRETPANASSKSVPVGVDNNVKLPDTYSFSYHTTMQVNNSSGRSQTEYYLEPKQTYYAKKLSKTGPIEHVVYDTERNKQVYFTEIEGEKRRAHKTMDIFTKAAIVGAFKDTPNNQVKVIGEQNLLGYNCKGYEIITDTGTTQLWITDEAPATLFGAMFANHTKVSNSIFSKNAMIMKLSYNSKVSPNKNYNMQFTQLQPTSLVFNNSEYTE